ncbi:MAG TPA: ABC transporter permease, partial [Cyclobacteriaceae bacterium]|nr:ABC transporter permease [Cyclobacteriaceae bacterium]
MFRNYLTISLRIFSRQKIYSFINIVGLAIGIAATLHIALYLIDEFSYDRFQKDGDRIYRIATYIKFGNNETSHCYSDSKMAGWITREVPEVESVIRLAVWPAQSFKYRDKAFIEKNVLEVDSNFFSFFSFKLLSGNPAKALSEPNKILITQSAAKKYFNYNGPKDASPIGNILLVGPTAKAMEVTGIVQDPPANSHFHFDMLVPRDLRQDTAYRNAYTYYKIFRTADAETVAKRFPIFYKKFVDTETSGPWHDMLRQPGNDYHFFAQPLLSIHLDSHLLYELSTNGDKKYLYLLGGIALFIILLACINYINLSTARAISRVKEIAVRKTMGSFLQQLIQQFMLESYLYTGTAFILSFGLVFFTINSFNELTGKELSMHLLMNPSSLLGLLVFFILTGLMAGLYPSFYLSSFKPVEIFKSNKTGGRKKQTTRNLLIIFQFVISISLIISTLTVFKQITFMQSQNPGFDRESILYLSNIESLGQNLLAFKNEIQNQNAVLSASYSSQLPPEVKGDFSFKLKDTEEYYVVRSQNVDPDNLKTLGYKLAEGRFFSKEMPSDSFAVVINKQAARLFRISNLKNNPLLMNTSGVLLEVIGIVDDFNFESFRSEVKPLIMLQVRKGDYGSFLDIRTMAIRFSPGETSAKISLIQST